MTTNEQELLPCAFCGSADVGESIGKSADGSNWRYIECTNCSACAEPEYWNRRAQQPSAGFRAVGYFCNDAATGSRPHWSQVSDECRNDPDVVVLYARTKEGGAA